MSENALNNENCQSNRLVHISNSFPCGLLECRLGDEGSTKLEPSNLNDFRFVKVLQGTLNVSVNGEIFSVNESQGLFINSEPVAFASSKKKRLVRFQVVSISPSLLIPSNGVPDKLVSPIMDDGVDALLLSGNIPYQRDVLRAVQEIFDSYSSGRNSYELQIISIFFKMVYLLFPHVPFKERKSSGKTQACLKNMVSFMESHYGEDITLLDIAKSGPTSKRNANRLFLTFLNVTPVNYLIELRLRKASEILLNEPDKPIKEIASQVGYPTVSFFIQVFKKSYGLSPNKYRQKKLGKK